MKIIIKVEGCCKFYLDVGPQEPILQIKKKIQQRLAIPVDSQILTVCDWELVDGLDLDDYPLISDGTIFQLTTHSPPPPPPPPSPPKLRLTVKFSARRIQIEADGTDTVRSLKEKIHIVDGTPMRRMTLSVNDTEMSDDYRSLSDYEIEDGSEIVMSLKTAGRAAADLPARKVSMVVEMSASLKGARVPLEMKDTSRVSEVQQVLVEKGELPADNYIFIHKQRLMSEDCTLRWHGVENGDFLYVFNGTISGGQVESKRVE